MMARDQRRVGTTRVTNDQARTHARRAEGFLAVAEKAFDAGYYAEAAANAVQAGIHAADAVCGLLTGTQWAGAHEQAAGYAESVGPEGKEVAKHLRRLIAKKTQVQYEAVDLSELQASKHMQSARRAVTISTRLARRVG